MPKQLYNLEPAEVSLVPRGANKKKFLIFKAHKGETMDQETYAQIAKGDPKVLKKVEAIIKAFDKEMKKDGGQGMSDKAQTAMKAIARIATPFKDELPQDLLKVLGLVEPENAGAPGEGETGIGAKHGEDNEMKKAQGQQDGEDEETGMAEDHEVEMADGDGDEDDVDDMDIIEQEDDGEEIPHGMKPEHHAAAKEFAKAAYKKAMDEHVKKLGYKVNPTEQPTYTNKKGEADPMAKKVMKSDGTLDLSMVPKEMQPILTAIYKGNQELVKKNLTLEKELKHEREIRVQKEFKEKAAAFTHIGTEQEELATILKSVSEKDPEAATKIEAILKAANEQVAKGDLFKEYGSNQAAKGGTSWDQIEQAAMNFVAKSGEKLTKEQAVEKYMTTDAGQKQYAEYKNSRPGGI